MLAHAPHTRILSDHEDIPLSEGVYLYGSLEERSHHIRSKLPIYKNVKFLKVEESEDGQSFTFEGMENFVSKTIANFHEALIPYEKENIYLDITGLSHSIWAPVMKCLIERKISFRVVYVEPFEYTKTFSSDQGPIYDLSEKIRGVSPIPGFASFVTDEENFLFVPLLGFEGARFKFMVENVEPVGSNTFPFVGVPGFRAEYPFFTYQSNRLSLKETGSWKNVTHADANCPFAAFMELEALAEQYPSLGLKIALIGTKPHSLGAIMFRLAYPDKTEILYDHPIRKQKRTKGISKKHIYDVVGFFDCSSRHRALMAAERLR